MDWLTPLVGADNVGFASLALWLVLGLVVIWVLFRLLRSPNRVLSTGSRHRLEVIDATAIDNRRRLVLVRCDDREHLVLIGGMNDLVLDKDINQRPERDERVGQISEAAPTVDIAVAATPVAATKEAPKPKSEPAPAPTPARAPEPVIAQAENPVTQSKPATPAPARPPEAQPARNEEDVASGLRRSSDRAWTTPSEPQVSGRRMTDIANMPKPVSAPAAAATVAAAMAAPAITRRDEIAQPDDSPAFAGLVADRNEPQSLEAAPEIDPVVPTEEDSMTNAPPIKREPTLEEDIEAEMDRLINDLASQSD